MNSDRRTQIYNNMKLKDTEELLSIWIINNRKVWSDEAIEVTAEILRERNVELPERVPPAYEESEDEEEEYNPEDFTEEERKIIEDDNPPEFYDPFEVLSINRWLKWMAKIMVVFFVISELIRYPSIKQTVDSYFVAAPFQTVAFRLFETTVVVATMLVLVTLSAAVCYFMLTGLSYILKILMEMEYNSRK